MKKYFFPLLLLWVFFSANSLAATQDWRIVKSRHFVIHYKNAEDSFIEKLIDKAEGCYDSIAEDLGFRRYDFWLWDNRAKIYIYDSAQDYQQATGQPAWSAGVAVPQKKIINSFFGAPGFFQMLLPHEMGHIIFREFVGFDNPAVPLWLEEGVASYQGYLRSGAIKGLIKRAKEKDAFMDLGQLEIFELSAQQDKERVSLFYSEAVAIVDYLVKKFGKDSFVDFCRKLRDKRSLNSALAAVYPFKSAAELGVYWEDYLEHD